MGMHRAPFRLGAFIGKRDDGDNVVIKTCSTDDLRQRAQLIKMNLGEVLGPLGFVA